MTPSKKKTTKRATAVVSKPAEGDIVFNSFRHDGLDEFFEQSGIRNSKSLKHMPLMVVGFDKKVATVVKSAEALLSFEPNDWVLAVWPGRWRCDAFRFTVGQFIEYMATHPKSASQVI